LINPVYDKALYTFELGWSPDLEEQGGGNGCHLQLTTLAATVAIPYDMIK
jgi:hypothetical protein